MSLDPDTLWHYATPRPSMFDFLFPLCWPADRIGIEGRNHGQTKYRGDVTCPDCLEVMAS